MHCIVQVCVAAVGLVGDLCRALGLKVMPHCNDLMNLLLENLSVSRYNSHHCSNQSFVDLYLFKFVLNITNDESHFAFLGVITHDPTD